MENGRRCPRPATDPHHRLTRTRAGRRIDELWNLLHLCRICHDWIDANPAEAEERGYLLPSNH